MFGITSIQEAATLTEEPLKMAIIGPPGVGKSWLACTAPKPVFDIDFDGRKSSLAGKTGVTVKTYMDLDPNNPRMAAELESDLGTIEYEKKKGNPTPATYVLDSLTYMRKACESELIKQQSTLSRSLKVGSRQIKIGQGWDIVNGNRAFIEYLIGRLSALGNLIVICHTQDEKDKIRSTATEKAYTGKTTIQPEYMATILSLFNDTWLLEADYKGVRTIYSGLSAKFDGKNSLGMAPEVKLDKTPDFQYIEFFLAEHRKKMAAAQATVAVVK